MKQKTTITFPEISYFNVAEIELTYQNPVKPSQRALITNSLECDNLFLSHWGNTVELHEDFYVML